MNKRRAVRTFEGPTLFLFLTTRLAVSVRLYHLDVGSMCLASAVYVLRILNDEFPQPQWAIEMFRQ